MPYRIVEDTLEAPAQSGASEHGDPARVLEIELWAHSSLPPNGFVVVIGATFAMICIPLVALLGTAALWGVLPFAMGAVALLWLALKRSWRDRSMTERFRLVPDLARLVRLDPDGTERAWEANPYWVRVEMHGKEGPVEDYLTLEGGPRPVEIGAFLTPEERVTLREVLLSGLRAARAA